jgi:hypothetical protein
MPSRRRNKTSSKRRRNKRTTRVKRGKGLGTRELIVITNAYEHRYVNMDKSIYEIDSETMQRFDKEIRIPLLNSRYVKLILSNESKLSEEDKKICTGLKLLKSMVISNTAFCKSAIKLTGALLITIPRIIRQLKKIPVSDKTHYDQENLERTAKKLSYIISPPSYESKSILKDLTGVSDEDGDE